MPSHSLLTVSFQELSGLAPEATGFLRESPAGGPPEPWALVVRSLLSENEAASASDRVLEARPHWVGAFDDTQFTLGRAWYTHLEEGKTHAYFEGARHADALVERHASVARKRVLSLLALLCGAPLEKRPGFCGPGVHVFPAGGWVSKRGGEFHADLEGLTDAQLHDQSPAVTAVLLLKAPVQGGALRLWQRQLPDALPEGQEDLRSPPPNQDELRTSTPFVDCPLQAGDGLVFPSRRLHEIQPFSGSSPRITMTVHAARLASENHWEYWF